MPSKHGKSRQNGRSTPSIVQNKSAYENMSSGRDLGFCLRCDGRSKLPDCLSPPVLDRDIPIMDKARERARQISHHGVDIKTSVRVEISDVTYRTYIKRNFYDDRCQHCRIPFIFQSRVSQICWNLYNMTVLFYNSIRQRFWVAFRAVTLLQSHSMDANGVFTVG